MPPCSFGGGALHILIYSKKVVVPLAPSAAARFTAPAGPPHPDAMDPPPAAAAGGGRFWLDTHALLELAFALPAPDLARARAANRFCARELAGARAVRWICGVRGLGLGARCTCLEHVELAEALAALPLSIHFEFGSHELDEASGKRVFRARARSRARSDDPEPEPRPVSSCSRALSPLF